MSPWDILEWVTSVGLSVIVAVATIVGVGLGIRFVMTRRDDVDGDGE